MSVLRAARAALVSQSGFPRILAAIAVVLAGFFVSCGNDNDNHPSGPNHRAYVTLPATGNVLQINITGATGVITSGEQTPQVGGTTPTGLALLPNKAFLYTANSRANTISILKLPATVLWR